LYQDNFKKVLISETEVTCNNNRTDIVEQIQERHLQLQSSLKESELASDKSLVDEDINDETGSFDVIINKKEPKRGVKRRLTDDSDCLEAKVLDIHKPVVETTIEIKSEHLIQSTSETKLEEGTEKVFGLLFQSTRDRVRSGPRPGFFLYPESGPRHFLTFLGVSWTTGPGSGPGQ